GETWWTLIRSASFCSASAAAGWLNPNCVPSSLTKSPSLEKTKLPHNPHHLPKSTPYCLMLSGLKSGECALLPFWSIVSCLATSTNVSQSHASLGLTGGRSTPAFSNISTL